MHVRHRDPIYPTDPLATQMYGVTLAAVIGTMQLPSTDPPVLRDLLVVILAYGLGTLCAGYYLVRARTGLDLRYAGSGAVGGTNAARVLGRWAFVAVAVFDGTKGAVAVLVAEALGLEGVALGAVVFAVVLGHVFPAQLGFHGGRGGATSFGAYVAYYPPALVTQIAAFAIAYALSRKKTMSGLIGFAAAPVAALVLVGPGVMFTAIAATSLLVVAAHRRRYCPAAGEND